MTHKLKLTIGILGLAGLAIACNNVTTEEVNEQTAAVTFPETSAPVEIGTPDESQAPDITFKTLEVNFGTIKQGDSFDYDFEFTNTGTSDLVITGARGSCGCTVPEWPHEPIKAGGKGVIHVKFNSAGKSNNQTKTVTLQTNVSPTPITLYLKGFVEVPK